MMSTLSIHYSTFDSQITVFGKTKDQLGRRAAKHINLLKDGVFVTDCLYFFFRME